MADLSPTDSGVLSIGRTIVPNSFEEKMAKDLRVCASTGKLVDISYHTFGDASNPMMLLISGLNTQGVACYDSATCTWLSRQGYYVVRMDNRDVGLSTKFDDVPQYLNIPYLMLPSWMAYGERQPYTLDDMADDASALIRHLSKDHARVQPAHLVGVSMGGMIAQCVALRNPELVASLTLIMTHSGNHKVAPPPFSTLIGFLNKPKSRSVEHLCEYRRWFISSYLVGEPMTDFTLLELIEKEFPRSLYMTGIKRHMAAVQRAPCRDELLKALDAAGRIPTHIVHGALDKLVPVGNGYHLSKLMPSAKLSVFPVMGHYIDPTHAQSVLETIVAFTRGQKPQ